MFRTLRYRLLFWFLLFISSSLIIIALSVAYLQQRENINRTTRLIESSYTTLLKKVVAQQNFLSYDTKNGAFFLEGESNYLDRSERLSDSTLILINAAEEAVGKKAGKILDNIHQRKNDILIIDSLNSAMVEKIKARGFKDYMLEGAMRDDAHWLEDIPEIPAKVILSLRRHEKDYIIRNEQKYVEQLNQLVEEIRSDLQQNSVATGPRTDSILFHLNAYQQKFNQLVALDSAIGMKDNTGLKKELDDRVKKLEVGFAELVKLANQRKQRLFFRLNFIFILLGIALVSISLWLSYVMSKRITQPLTDLTVYITRFVDSNFTLQDENPQVRSKDEIGKLTQNFSILKEEIINQLKYFKEKVDERTKELANANKRLISINESNSRFVPKEFINFLGKKSIEEVKLGDHSQREMTILFTDIRSFTKISETLSPRENFEFLNDYLNEIVPIIQKNKGIIDKFIGDMVMALFPDDPEDALQAALELDEALKEFNFRQTAIGHQPILTGTGIHTGQLILGTIGNRERLETTVISDAVNIASRVEGLTKFYQAKIILTEETRTKLSKNHSFHYRFLDFVKVKGKSTTLSVFELISPLDSLKLSYQEDYKTAVALMRKRKMSEAAAIFSKIYNTNPHDDTVKVILDRCNEYIKNGLPEGWDGVEKMNEK